MSQSAATAARPVRVRLEPFAAALAAVRNSIKDAREALQRTRRLMAEARLDLPEE
jgi:hypothetical protein